MKSINQINAFCANNASFQHLSNLYALRNSYTEAENYKTKSYKFNFAYQNASGEFVNYKDNVPFSNFIYHACETELLRFCGIKNYTVRRESYKLASKHFDIQISLRLKIGFDGILFEYSCFESDLIGFGQVKVKSSDSFESLNLPEYFEKQILSKILFNAGLFREIQLLHGCDKKQAIAIYKDLSIENQLPLSEFATQQNAEKSYRRYLRKHFNLLFDGFETIEKMQAVKNIHGKQKKLTQIERFPITFNDFMNLTDDCDFEDIEGNFYDILEREQQTIFI